MESFSKKQTTARKTMASVAHLVGPGRLGVQNRMPRWQPIKGPALALHPEALEHVFLYGATDISGTAMRLLWRHDVNVSFLSPAANELLGRLQPPASQRPALAWLQHQAALDSEFSSAQARQLVLEKVKAQAAALRHYQRQGHRVARRIRLAHTKAEKRLKARHLSMNSLLGVEGTASRNWHEALGNLFEGFFRYESRRSHPPTDPVNALLSLGYMLLLSRIQALLGAYGFDPLIGFLHAPRAGRPSLACDLIEPFRAPMVDRMVVAEVRQRRFSVSDFNQTGEGCRLHREAFRRYLQCFEKWLAGGNRLSLLHERIRQFEQDVRRRGGLRGRDG